MRCPEAFGKETQPYLAGFQRLCDHRGSSEYSCDSITIDCRLLTTSRYAQVVSMALMSTVRLPKLYVEVEIDELVLAKGGLGQHESNLHKSETVYNSKVRDSLLKASTR